MVAAAVCLTTAILYMGCTVFMWAFIVRVFEAFEGFIVRACILIVHRAFIPTIIAVINALV